MYSVLRLLDVAEHERGRVVACVRSWAEATRAHHRLVEPTLPGSRNGGDVLVTLRFGSRSQWLSVANEFADVMQDNGITRINGATYPGAPTPAASARGPSTAPYCYG